MGFDSFIGNTEAVSTAREMLRRDAIPGSLLFTGPAGVGKNALARMLGKALNCERLRDDFCGHCPACLKSERMLALAGEDLDRRRETKDPARRVEGLVYFDLQLIAPITRFILVEQIRQLRNTAYTRPFELPRRIFIVDQAQAIHWQAVDLLLKVVEEPPESATFILICPNANELRATLRSRCHKIQFRPVQDSAIRTFLREKRGIQPSEIELAIRYVSGSIGSANSLDLADFRAKRKPWMEYFEAVAARDWRSTSGAEWKAFFETTKALTGGGSDIQENLRIGYALLADMLQIIGSEENARIINVDIVPRLRHWARGLGVEGLDRLRIGLDDAYRLQTRNVNPQLSWEDLAFETSAGR